MERKALAYIENIAILEKTSEFDLLMIVVRNIKLVNIILVEESQ